MEELPVLINYVSFARKNFNQFFQNLLETFKIWEKVEGQRVHWAKGSSVKGSSQQSGPLALSLREGGLLFSGGSHSLRGVGKWYYSGVMILTEPPFFRAPMDNYNCCEWDPLFINVDFLAINFKSHNVWYFSVLDQKATYLKYTINSICWIPMLFTDKSQNLPCN